ncbi:MarR family winged helix-turn-helix transcriptional regulator [Streptomyces sp. NPDC049577]|uniref:MarR family winged helix-turn-helix transcriptional regulator n=1 Tax=Streptomyces sp. NPDC049577 TaxID=3155153 RepID=UPI0034190624
MAAHEQYEELARQLSAIGAVKRGLNRALPPQCPPAAAFTLSMLRRYGELRMSRIAELLDVDMSVTSRHVAYAAEHGWLDRKPDPLDKRSRLVTLTPEGEALLDEVSARCVDALAHCLRDWSDDDVGLLNGLLARLREGFGECRTPRAPERQPAGPPARTPA